MKNIMHVKLSQIAINRNYEIQIYENDFGDSNNWGKLLHAYQKVVIVTNETVALLYLEQFKKILNTSYNALENSIVSIVLSDGEKYKNLTTVNHIYTELLSINATRKTVLIALGGGVIGDMVGYAAATYMRGIDFIQVPTTLLSQVDSSIGGKTAVNHELGKNMIGAFYQPKAVVMNTETLATLSKREYIAGMAEIIKYALIFDVNFWNYLKENINVLKQYDSKQKDKQSQENQENQENQLIYIIKKSCEWKAKTVFEDETEQGIRALLNFGHTFGHAIEHALGYGVWLHGEAIGCGMILAAKLSHHLKLIDDSELSDIIATIASYGLPINPPQEISIEQWLNAMARDKKNHTEDIRFIVLTQIGHAKIISLSIEETRVFLNKVFL